MSKLTKKFHHSPYPAISPTRPELSTTGKTVFVTGGGTGIGYACAEAFAQSGAANIIITSRTSSALQAAKQKLSTAYPKTSFHALTTDISDETSIATTFAIVARDIGTIDIFVANAGYAPRVSKVADMDIADFRRGVETNLIGTFLCARAFIRQLPSQSSSSSSSTRSDPVFIHISTGHAHATPQGPLSGYGATKAAAAKVVDYLSAENQHVRVYAIHPGAIPTNMTASMPRGQSGAKLREVPELPGQFCVWLASQEAVFLRSRFLWASWDVEELMAMEGAFKEDSRLATIGLKFPGSRL